MIHQLQFFVVLFYSFHVNAYFELNGRLVEHTELPVTLQCAEFKLGWISVGGITVNNIPLDSKLQMKAKQQCEKQLKKYEEMKKKPHLIPHDLSGTSCVLTFPGAKIEDTDVIRIVFNCHDQQPNGSPSWGEEKGNKKEPKIKTAQCKANSDTILTCTKSRQDVITVTSVKSNGNDVPDFPQRMNEECYKEWLDMIKEKKGRGKPMCTIRSPAYGGGKLDIEYYCLSPGQSKKIGGPVRT